MRGAIARRFGEVEYPSSDGKPMAETEIHMDEMFALIHGLRHRYARRDDVYVCGNMLLYYEEGNPKARFAPDAFVVFGIPKRKRRILKLWEEKTPSVVVEVTSKSTWLEDEGKKRALCARLGVAEYFMFDPLAEYLDPSLQGFELVAGTYQPIRGASGGVPSAILGVTFKREGHQLRVTDTVTGERILRPEEAEAARSEAEAARSEAEAARSEAEARAEAEAKARREAEAQVTALEVQLARRRSPRKKR